MSLSLPTCLLGGVPPLQLDIARYPVSNGNVDVLARGIAVTIGQEQDRQFFSLLADIRNNNTFISGASRCPANDNDCLAAVGGVYNYIAGQSASTTNNLDEWNGSSGYDVVPLNAYTSFVFYNDDAYVDGAAAYGLPFASVRGYDDAFQARLGLGPNSSYLETALQSGVVPSKQYSFWPGHDSRIDGILVIGGYDANRIAPDNELHRYSMTQDPLGRYQIYLEMERLEWMTSSGNLTSLLPETDTPRTYTTTLSSTWNNIDVPAGSENLLGSLIPNAAFNSTSQSWNYNDVLEVNGQLVVTFVDGFKVNIQPWDLFGYDDPLNNFQGALPDRNIRIDDYNSSTAGSPSNPFLLGLPFMTSVLFMVDYDEKVFYLANATAGKVTPNIQTLCTGGPNSGRKAPNVAAIAGGVDGGVGALLIIGAIVGLFCLRRRRNDRKRQEELSKESHMIAAEPERAAMTSPPAYMSAGIYEANGDPVGGEYQQRYGSLPPRQQYASPLSELPSQQMQSGGKNGVKSREDEKYEMAANGTSTARNGPFEM